jgi:hypothetical protein
MADEPEIEAVREALRDFLTLQLLPQFPTIEVLSEWPNEQQLPEFCVSILVTGEADDWGHAPRVVSTSPGPPSVVTYQYGYADAVQLELDCWAMNKPDRDQLQLAVRRALNQPPQTTLPGASDGKPRFKRRAYLTLQVPGLFGAPFTYRFHQVPTIDESSLAAEKNEWRSHFRGTAEGPLWAQEQMPTIKQIGLTLNVGPGALGATANNQQATVYRPATQLSTTVVPAAANLRVGATLQLKAIARFSDGSTQDVTSTATWGTSSSGVATASAAGLVSAVGAGSAVITATSGGISGTCNIAAA